MAPPKQLITRHLGKNGPQVSPVGLGLMGASGLYDIPASDTDIYGDSEHLLGKRFAANPSKRKGIFLTTKFGHPKRDPANLQGTRAMNTTPEYFHDALEASLKRLGLPYIDLYYIHRLDRVTPSRRLSKQWFNSKTRAR
ncbi:hypothetical protein AFLA70_149g002171 [Aspergillus flavus AF70]|nr:hypothetical protein AFLA70_149g002171 [Aspergillus flavus AF70]